MKLLLLLFLIISIPDIEHDLQVANFKIHQESNIIYLDIDFDMDDISQELQVSESELTAPILEEFLNLQTEFTFDNHRQHLKVKKIERIKDHLFIQSEFEEEHNSIHSIEIKNTFLQSNTTHSNIIELRLNGQERDFLMNNLRTYIKVQF